MFISLPHTEYPLCPLIEVDKVVAIKCSSFCLEKREEIFCLDFHFEDNKTISWIFKEAGQREEAYKKVLASLNGKGYHKFI